jgi:hypothetical protein
MYTPTGPRFLRKFRSGSVAHEAVVVGDHNSKDSVLKSELHRSIGNEIKHMTKLKPQAAAVEDLNNAVIGSTQMSGEEIREEGELMPFF